MRSIWDKFRAALCISGGNRRPPPTYSPPVLVGGGDEGGGGEALQEDLLSALPDDLLLVVLLRLPSAAAAARTSVLSRRWRRLWADLPWLLFPEPADLAGMRPALAALAAPALHQHIVASDADPGDAAAVLLLAAPRLTGMLVFHDAVPHRAWTGGNVDLPCFEKAVWIHLCLGYHGLAFPLTGVFAKLTVLHLYCVRFHVSCDLGVGLSSARCPSPRVLSVYNALGVSNFAIHQHVFGSCQRVAAAHHCGANA